MAVLLVFSASKYQRIFRLNSKQCFLAELVWLLIPSSHLYEM